MILLRTPPLLFAAVLLSACSESSPPANTEPAIAATRLATLVVQSVRTARETAFDGVIEAINQATVAAQTGGRVVELPFDVGDYVPKDAVIVRLTGVEQKAQAGGAAAALREASARQSEARLQYDRIADLFTRGIVAQAALDRAKADLDSASARVEAARNALTQAREQSGYTVVRAPYGGIVVKRHVEMGETVSAGRPLMSGLSLEHLRAVVEVPQQHIGPLRSHKKARVIFPDGRTVAASELRIPPNADPATQTFRVLVALPQGRYGGDDASGTGTFPGTLVKVAFTSGESEQILLPAGALVRRGEVTGVYVLGNGGQIGLRYLRTGTPAADGRIPVLAGLNAGERVATDPIAAGIAYKQAAARAGTGE